MEKEKIVPLKCHSKASDIFQSEKYIGNNMNYEYLIGMCPIGCSKDAFVIGRGIHHQDSRKLNILKFEYNISWKWIFILKANFLNNLIQRIKFL